MKRIVLWICCTLILAGAPSALAQYHGGGHRNSGGASGPTPDTKNNDLKGFERAVALQATPDQITQFRQLSASTQTARKRAQDLLQLPASTTRPEWIHNTYPLTNDVEEALAENERFLLSLSKEQESGLKKFAKKLRRTHSEITNHSKTLNRNLESNEVAGRQIPDVLQKLNTALGEFQSAQLAIAAEMGIPGHESK